MGSGSVRSFTAAGAGILLWMGLTAGCAPEPPRPQPMQVTPNAGSNTTETPIEIVGAGFIAYPLTDLDRSAATVRADFVASLGDYPLSDVELLDAAHLLATVPAGLPPTLYDLTVVDSAGQSGTLSAAFTVLGADAGTGSDSGVGALDSGVGVLDSGVGALGPFGVPMLLGGVSDPAAPDDDPSLTSDLLELYFCSGRPGGMGQGDIWVSVRASTASPWGSPQPIVEVNSTENETTPAVSSDGLTLWLASTRPAGMGLLDVWVSTRPDRASAWSVPVNVAELNSPDVDVGLGPSASGLWMAFISNRPGGLGMTDVWISSRTSTATPWGAPSPLLEVSSSFDEHDPYLSPQARYIFFAATIPSGMGARDIYLASRPDTAIPFSAPTPVTELNSPAGDGDPWLSDDLRYVIFWSDRSGNGDLYEAWR